MLMTEKEEKKLHHDDILPNDTISSEEEASEDSDDTAHIDQSYDAENELAQGKIKEIAPDLDKEAERETEIEKEREFGEMLKRIEHETLRVQEMLRQNQHEVLDHKKDKSRDDHAQAQGESKAQKMFYQSNQARKMDRAVSWGETAANLGPLEKALVIGLIANASRIFSSKHGLDTFLKKGFSELSSAIMDNSKHISQAYLKNGELGNSVALGQTFGRLAEGTHQQIGALRESVMLEKAMGGQAPQGQHIEGLTKFLTGQWQSQVSTHMQGGQGIGFG